MGETIHRETGGRIGIRVYHSGQLGKETDAINLARFGALDIARVNIAALNNAFPLTDILALPYVFDSTQHMRRALDGAPGREVLQAFEARGLVGLAFYDSGTRCFYNHVRPIVEPTDLHGLKIRVPPSDIFVGLARALGANPTPLPFPEVFNALQQGVIDGDANPLTSVQTFRWYESTKYVSFTNTAVGIGVFIINEPFFQKLPKPQQDMIVMAAAESIKANRASEADLNKKAVAFLRTQGVNVDTPNQDEFRAKLTPVFDEAKKRFGADLLDRIGAAQKGC
jgi:tripartite ATP-independent transporter DctP family solute receptor